MKKRVLEGSIIPNQKYKNNLANDKHKGPNLSHEDAEREKKSKLLWMNWIVFDKRGKKKLWYSNSNSNHVSNRFEVHTSDKKRNISFVREYDPLSISFTRHFDVYIRPHCTIRICSARGLLYCSMLTCKKTTFNGRMV